MRFRLRDYGKLCLPARFVGVLAFSFAFSLLLCCAVVVRELASIRPCCSLRGWFNPAAFKGEHGNTCSRLPKCLVCRRGTLWRPFFSALVQSLQLIRCNMFFCPVQSLYLIRCGYGSKFNHQGTACFHLPGHLLTHSHVRNLRRPRMGGEGSKQPEVGKSCLLTRFVQEPFSIDRSSRCLAACLGHKTGLSLKAKRFLSLGFPLIVIWRVNIPSVSGKQSGARKGPICKLSEEPGGLGAGPPSNKSERWLPPMGIDLRH